MILYSVTGCDQRNDSPVSMDMNLVFLGNGGFWELASLQIYYAVCRTMS